MNTLPTGTPFYCAPMTLHSDWIDYNGHLNMAYYNVLFDRCVDEAFFLIGLGPDYIKTRNLSFFTAEIHVCYLRELHLDHSVICSFQLLECDAKKVRFYQELSHAEEGWISATCEQLSLHVDMAEKRVVPFPDDIMANIEKLHDRHKRLPWPQRAGRGIAMKKATA